MNRETTIRSSSGRLHALIAAFTAFTLSAGFTFIGYARHGIEYGAYLDSDHFGLLGFGLWHNGSLSFYPGTEVTLTKGPGYPMFIAAVLELTGGWWPSGVQLAQCLLMSGTVLLTYALGRALYGQRAAKWAAWICAFHPFLI